MKLNDDEICGRCGKPGHKADNCWANMKRNEFKGGNDNSKKKYGGKGKFHGKFKGKCNYCGKIGHKEADCWKKDSNANKRPANWKKKRDDDNDEVGDAGIDICLLCGCCGSVDVAIMACDRSLLILDNHELNATKDHHGRN